MRSSGWQGKSDNKIVALLSKPGLMLQHLTTREPEPEMAEVAISSGRSGI